MSQLHRRNKISIDLIPNNYYVQIDQIGQKHRPAKTGQTENNLTMVELFSMQIKKVEIYKSYFQHITDVVVEIDNIDSNIATLWSEGKYVALLSIEADSNTDGASAFDNYFLCSELVRLPVSAGESTYGFIQTVSAKVTLKSITRTRLETENNFPFELGGRNGKGAAGIGKPPKEFMDYDLQDLYNRNYTDEGFETVVPWNTEYCDWIEEIHQVRTSPANGYKMITDTNFQALEYFFKHYPIFNTPYDWILDDFNTSNVSITTLRIADLAWWEAWESNINVELSNLINLETEDAGKTSTEYRTAAGLNYFGIQKIDHIAYYDWVKFYVKNGFPKIWAVDVSSGKPIPMNAWNEIHEESRVLTPTGAIKSIPNPMYREYLTFMTAKEIEETQLHLNMFQEMNPILEKYSFTNLYVGEVDIHTVIELKLKNPEISDRLGMGYQVLHTYERNTLMPLGFNRGASVMQSGEIDDSQFAYSYTLNSEIVFLTLDKLPLTIEVSGSEDAGFIEAVPTAEQDYYQTDDCDERIDLGKGVGGSDGAGIPGNTSIADQAVAIYGNGFKYIWGGKVSPQQGLDCSGFTSLAVKKSGIGNFPGGTSNNQRNWCRRNANQITGRANIQRGDLLFFNYGNARAYGHTGVAISNSQFMHASGGRKKDSHGRYYSHGKAKTTSFASYHPKIMEIYRLKGGSK